jgi:hypothetical protein
LQRFTLPPSTAYLTGRQAVVLTTSGKVLSRRMLRLVEDLAADLTPASCRID